MYALWRCRSSYSKCRLVTWAGYVMLCLCVHEAYVIWDDARDVSSYDRKVYYIGLCVTDIGFGQSTKHFRNGEHHLLSSMSSGEHPLRVGT